jgi:hypothetical protein
MILVWTIHIAGWISDIVLIKVIIPTAPKCNKRYHCLPAEGEGKLCNQFSSKNLAEPSVPVPMYTMDAEEGGKKEGGESETSGKS